MTVNGYEVEEAANGAWWVRRPGTRQAWRFATKRDALAFVGQLQAPAPGRQTDPAQQQDRWGRGAA